MATVNAETITQIVLAASTGGPDKRVRKIMTSLVQHLHAFTRDVGLSEAEWAEGIKFLTRVGQFTDERRQEFILLSDVLGLSMLVTSQSNEKPAECTEATVLGPFYTSDAPKFANGDDISGAASGDPCFVSGTVKGPGGRPVPGARLEVWQADDDGFYDVQLGEAANARGIFTSDTDGRFSFRSILPQSYAIPHDGPVGDLLKILGRHPWRPAHLHFKIEAEGYERLITHVFRSDDPYLDSDAVFGVRASLIADWVRHPPGCAPEGTILSVPFYTLAFDFILNPVGGDR